MRKGQKSAYDKWNIPVSVVRCSQNSWPPFRHLNIFSQTQKIACPSLWTYFITKYKLMISDPLTIMCGHIQMYKRIDKMSPKWSSFDHLDLFKKYFACNTWSLWHCGLWRVDACKIYLNCLPATGSYINKKSLIECIKIATIWSS